MTTPVTQLPVLDLLRERRRELGIDSMSSVLGVRNQLLRRGALIGAGLLGAVALLSGAVYLRHRYIQAQLEALKPIELKYKEISASNAQRDEKLRAQTATNRALAESLTSVRTSSSLLTDLQLRTPEGVQLSSAAVSGKDLTLKGQSVDPMAFGRINAMLLELQRSTLFDPKSVTLVKSERAAAQDERQKLAGIPAPVSFEIRGTFVDLTPRRQLEVMRQLGSEGMARRLQLLQSEGLIP